MNALSKRWRRRWAPRLRRMFNMGLAQSRELFYESLKLKLAAGERYRQRVIGTSMNPTLKDGRDWVVLGPIEAWPPKRGDVLFCRRADGSPVMHRVIRVVGDGVVLNGDGQTWLEGPVTRGMALARVEAIVKGGENGRILPVRKASYRLYSRIWMATRGVRRRMFAFYTGIKRVWKH